MTGSTILDDLIEVRALIDTPAKWAELGLRSAVWAVCGVDDKGRAKAVFSTLDRERKPMQRGGRKPSLAMLSRMKTPLPVVLALVDRAITAQTKAPSVMAPSIDPGAIARAERACRQGS